MCNSLQLKIFNVELSFSITFWWPSRSIKQKSIMVKDVGDLKDVKYLFVLHSVTIFLIYSFDFLMQINKLCYKDSGFVLYQLPSTISIHSSIKQKSQQLIQSCNFKFVNLYTENHYTDIFTPNSIYCHRKSDLFLLRVKQNC